LAGGVGAELFLSAHIHCTRLSKPISATRRPLGAMKPSHQMRFVAVLNRDGGTLRALDLDVFSSRLAHILEAAGHQVEVRIVSGPQIDATLAEAAASAADAVIAGGGDGTVSAAAAALMHTGKALAVLPAGTMNLFARSLGIPAQLDVAVEAFADGEIRSVDVASANGRPFVHQFSIGMHAKMVALREKMTFGSRLGKIKASARAMVATFLDPPSMKVSLTIGESEILARATGIAVSNNLFGDGHLPYADRPDGGVLGIYVTVAHARPQLFGFFLHMLRGRLRANPHVEIHEGREVVLRLLSRAGKRQCVIDGELLPLARKTELKIHHKALNVLVPRQAMPR
jgi:diacylglycerol kinase family enzyme